MEERKKNRMKKETTVGKIELTTPEEKELLKSIVNMAENYGSNGCEEEDMEFIVLELIEKGVIDARTYVF